MKKLLIVLIIFVLISPIFFVSCKTNNQISVYITETKSIEKMNIEDYVAGVTAAEIDESFSEEAIKSQSIIARTFTYYFLNNLKSKYEGADISNDVTEAQAYTSNIPDKIKNCVNKTSGLILKNNNEIVLPYYCSNCGGKSSLPTDVFAGNNNTSYESVDTFENQNNSKNFTWTATIEKSTILYTMKQLGHNLASVNSFSVYEKDEIGRAKSFSVAGIIVNANTFRITLGGNILKSTFITDIKMSETLEISGKGYGHGVGLSQWGANIMAQQNNTAEEILKHFYPNYQLTNVMWKT